VAIVWFSDEDRERMRREHEECMALRERDELFWEFLRERRPNGGIADRSGRMNHMIETGRINPWRKSDSE
jgi:hypothetical protein